MHINILPVTWPLCMNKVNLFMVWFCIPVGGSFLQWLTKKTNLGNFYLMDLWSCSQSLTEKIQAFIPFANDEFPPQIFCSILPTPQTVCL